MQKTALIGPALLALAMNSAQAAPPRTVPTVTRTVQLFSTLEGDWLDAVHQRDAVALKKIVADEFELRSASVPGRPTARAEWQQQAFAAPALESSIEQMAVHEYGELAVVSFMWKIAAPKNSAVPTQVFVVDTWKQMEGGWKAVARYAATVDGASKAVPGSDLATPAINKKY
ncbi:MAG: nuclear transport factor 2 family protein [Pseudomonadota bacterium]